MIRGLCALLTATVLSGFAYLLITGRYTKEGPTVVQLSSQHGVHLGDLFIAGAWLVGMTALLLVLIPDPETPQPADDVGVQAR